MFPKWRRQLRTSFFRKAFLPILSDLPALFNIRRYKEEELLSRGTYTFFIFPGPSPSELTRELRQNCFAHTVSVTSRLISDRCESYFINGSPKNETFSAASDQNLRIRNCLEPYDLCHCN